MGSRMFSQSSDQAVGGYDEQALWSGEPSQQPSSFLSKGDRSDVCLRVRGGAGKAVGAGGLPSRPRLLLVSAAWPPGSMSSRRNAATPQASDLKGCRSKRLDGVSMSPSQMQPWPKLEGRRGKSRGSHGLEVLGGPPRRRQRGARSGQTPPEGPPRPRVQGRVQGCPLQARF